MKKTVLILLLFLISGGGAPGNDEYSAHFPGHQRSVKIGILSKQLRLIREKGGGILIFTAKNPLTLYELSTGTLSETESIKLAYEQGSWRLWAGDMQPAGKFSLLVKKTEMSGSLKVKIGNELRRYPLPLTITRGGKDPLVTVTEEISRYSLDSAWQSMVPGLPSSMKRWMPWPGSLKPGALWA